MKQWIKTLKTLFTREDPEELHSLAGCEEFSKLNSYLKKLYEKNPKRLTQLLKTGRKKTGAYPLACAFHGYNPIDYSKPILLLRYGANPYLRTLGPYKTGYSEFFETIEERNLGKLCLLVLHNPNYKTALDPEGYCTVEAWLDRWDQSVDAVRVHYRGRILTAKAAIEFTAQAALDINQLKTTLQLAVDRKQYAQAIAACHRLTALYQAQAELEHAIPYPPPYIAKDAHIEKKKDFLIHHYQQYANFYNEKAQDTVRQAQIETGIIIGTSPSASITTALVCHPSITATAIKHPPQFNRIPTDDPTEPISPEKLVLT